MDYGELKKSLNSFDHNYLELIDEMENYEVSNQNSLNIILPSLNVICTDINKVVEDSRLVDSVKKRILEVQLDIEEIVQNCDKGLRCLESLKESVNKKIVSIESVNSYKNIITKEIENQEFYNDELSKENEYLKAELTKLHQINEKQNMLIENFKVDKNEYEQKILKLEDDRKYYKNSNKELKENLKNLELEFQKFKETHEKLKNEIFHEEEKKILKRHNKSEFNITGLLHLEREEITKSNKKSYDDLLKYISQLEKIKHDLETEKNVQNKKIYKLNKQIEENLEQEKEIRSLKNEIENYNRDITDLKNELEFYKDLKNGKALVDIKLSETMRLSDICSSPELSKQVAEVNIKQTEVKKVESFNLNEEIRQNLYKELNLLDYDFLNIIHNNKIINTLLNSLHENSLSEKDVFSDVIYLFVNSYKIKYCLVITGDYFNLIEPEKETIKFTLKLRQLSNIILPVRASNLVTLEFKENGKSTNVLNFEILRRAQLLYYLGDLFKLKEFGELELKYDYSKNFKVKPLITSNYSRALKIGFLMKKKLNFLSQVRYFERFVVLTNIGLLYFEDPSGSPRRLVPIIGSDILRVEVESEKRFCFEIRTLDGYICLFSTKTYEEREAWVIELALLNQDYKPKIDHTNFKLKNL